MSTVSLARSECRSLPSAQLPGGSPVQRLLTACACLGPKFVNVGLREARVGEGGVQTGLKGASLHGAPESHLHGERAHAVSLD